MLVGAAAFARADGAAIAALAAKAAADLGAVKDGWNGYGVLHSAASRVGALDLGFVPGEGGAERAADGGVRHARRPLPARRRRDRHRAGRLRHLYRQQRRPRRHARRRDPARRRLSGKIGDLRQHRRPGADGDARRRSRPAMRARTGRSCARCPTCWASGCPTIRSRRLRQALFTAYPHLQRIGQIAPGDAGRPAESSPRGGGSDRADAVPLERRATSTSPIRSRAARR